MATTLREFIVTPPLKHPTSTIQPAPDVMVLVCLFFATVVLVGGLMEIVTLQCTAGATTAPTATAYVWSHTLVAATTLVHGTNATTAAEGAATAGIWRLVRLPEGWITTPVLAGVHAPLIADAHSDNTFTTILATLLIVVTVVAVVLIIEWLVRYCCTPTVQNGREAGVATLAPEPMMTLDEVEIGFMREIGRLQAERDRRYLAAGGIFTAKQQQIRDDRAIARSRQRQLNKEHAAATAAARRQESDAAFRGSRPEVRRRHQRFGSPHLKRPSQELRIAAESTYPLPPLQRQQLHDDRRKGSVHKNMMLKREAALLHYAANADAREPVNKPKMRRGRRNMARPITLMFAFTMLGTAEASAVTSMPTVTDCSVSFWIAVAIFIATLDAIFFVFYYISKRQALAQWPPAPPVQRPAFVTVAVVSNVIAIVQRLYLTVSSMYRDTVAVADTAASMVSCSG
jgi:hypothetical protein